MGLAWLLSPSLASDPTVLLIKHITSGPRTGETGRVSASIVCPLAPGATSPQVVAPRTQCNHKFKKVTASFQVSIVSPAPSAVTHKRLTCGHWLPGLQGGRITLLQTAFGTLEAELLDPGLLLTSCVTLNHPVSLVPVHAEEREQSLTFHGVTVTVKRDQVHQGLPSVPGTREVPSVVGSACCSPDTPLM